MRHKKYDLKSYCREQQIKSIDKCITCVAKVWSPLETTHPSLLLFGIIISFNDLNPSKPGCCPYQ